MSGCPMVAVVIPFYQKSEGLLLKAVNSVFNQTYTGKIIVIVVDDGSPYPAKEDLINIQNKDNRECVLIEKENGGAGSARNRGLDIVPNGTRYVAFIDSDDEWIPTHLDNGIFALELGFEAFFSDHYAALYPDNTNFERIGTLNLEDHVLLDSERKIYQMTISAIEHTVSDGGGVIGTSNVIYDYEQFKELRFREEFYNGQDFFFWMDLSNLGAKWVFSTNIGCRCGQGINIYSGSGWGSDKSLQRLRNELFIWTSVPKFYSLTHDMKKANRRTIRNLQDSVVRDLVHRIANRKPISLLLIRDIFKMAPSTVMFFFIVPIKIMLEKIR